MTKDATTLRKDRERLAVALAEKQKREALAAIIAILNDLPQDVRDDVILALPPTKQALEAENLMKQMRGLPTSS